MWAPYLVAVVTLIALIASLHKERVATQDPRLARAVRWHHAVQFLTVVLALLVAVVASKDAKRLRLAELDNRATAAAAVHAAPILEIYLHRLVPARPIAVSFASTLAPTDAFADLMLERAMPQLAQQRRALLDDFGKLQRIAVEVLSESEVHGDRYPVALAKWASRTLELTPEDLPAILSESESGAAYADLLGRGVGQSVGAARAAQQQLER